MRRRVVIVEGPLAFRMRRLEAARGNDIGLDVLTLPLLAARLAGGFCRVVDRELLAPAIGAGYLPRRRRRSGEGLARSGRQNQ
jgi:hypothetical protein